MVVEFRITLGLALSAIGYRIIEWKDLKVDDSMTHLISWSDRQKFYEAETQWVFLRKVSCVA